MKASELRIGNLIYSKGLKENIKVEYSLLSNNDDCMNYLYNPIPLTDEWLVKFGFKKGVKGWFKTLDNNLKFNLYMYNRSLYLSVHQLQNLYFALTNEELTLKQ